MYLKFVCLALLLSIGHFQGIFTLYPLANDYFDIIYQIKHVSDLSSQLSSQDSSLFLRVYCKDHNVVSISLTPTLEFNQEPRFPIYSRQSKVIPKFQQEIYTFLSSCNVQVKAHPRQNSIVQIIRRDNKQPIFELSEVMLSNGHNKFTVIDKSTKWGLGQRFQQRFRVTDGFWTIWNRDKPWQIDHGKQGRSSSTYGHQPMYLARQNKDGFTHLTYFKNTHGVLVQTTQDSNKLTYNSIGGNIHFLVFVGDKNPQKTLQKYHDFIGGIHIPPFWALGWHQCRWGYKNIHMFTSVIENYEKYDLPLDTMWNDLDYMNQKAIFTIDESAYPSGSLKSLLEKKNLHWIPLIDVGVSLLDRESINEGRDLDVFLKSVNNPKQYYIGQVWPGKVHFVDYLHPNASQFWKKQLNRLYKKVPFSGVWLDMNQPSNFRGNQPVTEYYRIQQSESVNQMTIDVNLKHYSTYDKKNPLTHWEVHSYYGHTSTVPTFDFLKEHGRPFIISRSNSVGTGRYAGHWTGDNSATWAFMRLSISGNFLYQIFGIQMVGADICGFNGDTTQQLCSRWTQLGSLYPFARNHNQDIAKDQQPYVLGDNVLKTAKTSIKQRYSLLKQLYSILVDLNGKGSFFRPLYFEFFEDEDTLKQETTQTQFLLGKCLLSAPIVQEGKDKRNVYFPGKDVWYSLEYDINQPGLYKKQNVIKSINQNTKTHFEGGSSEEVSNKITTSPPLFLRSGFMIFSNKPEQRSRFLNNKFYVTAALNAEGVSTNRFLTIENYENETILGKCIEKKECLTKFQLKKSAGAAIQFELSWVFEGKSDVFGNIQLNKITVWEGDKEWVSKQESIKIDKPTGKITLEFQEISSK